MFAEAARRAKEAGFDGCEVMAAYNALFEQFWSPFTNRRDDAWGGHVRAPHALLVRRPWSGSARGAAPTSSSGCASASTRPDLTSSRSRISRRSRRGTTSAGSTTT